MPTTLLLTPGFVDLPAALNLVKTRSFVSRLVSRENFTMMQKSYFGSGPSMYLLDTYISKMGFL